MGSKRGGERVKNRCKGLGTPATTPRPHFFELPPGNHVLLIGARPLDASVIRAVAEKLRGKEDAVCLRLLAKDIFGPPKHTRSR